MIDVNNDVSLFKNKGTASNPTVLTSSLLKNSNEDNLDSGWYVLNSSFTYDERIVISGNVHLILKDGCMWYEITLLDGGDNVWIAGSRIGM